MEKEKEDLILKKAQRDIIMACYNRSFEDSHINILCLILKDYNFYGNTEVKQLADKIARCPWFGVDSGAVGELRACWGILHLETRKEIAFITKGLGYLFIP